jgi:WD40 repeat protein
VTSGCKDGTVRVWDADSGKTVLGLIKICCENVNSMPDTIQIATGRLNESAVKIWDVKTGKLLSSIEHTNQLRSQSATTYSVMIRNCSNEC